MSTYANRDKAGKVPTFKHRTLNWHLYCALGEKRMRRFKQLIGLRSVKHLPFDNFADVIYAPYCGPHLPCSRTAREKLEVRLLELYRQRLRLYCSLAGYPAGARNQIPVFTLYNLPTSNRIKNPPRCRKRFVRGKSLIQHLQLALSRRAYLAIRKNWKSDHPDLSWAKYCSTYERSYHMFGNQHILSHGVTNVNRWKTWDTYCRKNLPVEYHQHYASKKSIQQTNPAN